MPNPVCHPTGSSSTDPWHRRLWDAGLAPKESLRIRATDRGEGGPRLRSDGAIPRAVVRCGSAPPSLEGARSTVASS